MTAHELPPGEPIARVEVKGAIRPSPPVRPSGHIVGADGTRVPLYPAWTAEDQEKWKA